MTGAAMQVGQDGIAGRGNDAHVPPGARILHLLAPAPFGGLEQVVRSLAIAQGRSGHEVHAGVVLDPDVEEHALLSALEAGGVHVHAMRPPARAYGQERRLVAELCRAIRPDLVHTHGYRVDVLHGGTARKLGLPCVSTAHGFIGGGWKNRLYERLQRRAFQRCDAVVAVSQPMAAMLGSRGVSEERLHWIPNAWTGGVDFLERAEARRTLEIAEGQFCVGFIGRLGHEKGPDVLVEALGRTRQASAVVIGDGRLRPELVQRARALGMDRSIRWAGTIDEAARFMKAFDVVVLSSRTEGTPIVLLEAMAAEVPIVATRVGGIPDVVSEAEALLVPTEDPAALANAINQVQGDPQSARSRAGRAAERLRSEFGSRRWLDRYDDVYRACGVAAAGRAGP